MTPSFSPSKWAALGFLALALAFGIGSQADKASAAQAPGVALLATDPSALAGSSSGAFTLVRHGDTNVSLTVNLSFGGTAVNGTDYTALDSSVTLDPGVLAMDLVVQAQVNPDNRGNKTVVLTVQTNNGIAIYGSGTATVKIVDDLYDVPPPSVVLTNPVEGSVFTAPASITISADTTGSPLPLQAVNFYANNTFLGTVTNAPYTITWSNAPAGKHALFARAVDEFGKSGVSAPVDITVSAGPVVVLTPSSGTAVFMGEQVPLQAQPADPNEVFSKVSFYVNGTLLGTVTSAPFTITWPTTQLGTFNVKAVATDAKTGKTGSVTNQITVTVNAGA